MALQRADDPPDDGPRRGVVAYLRAIVSTAAPEPSPHETQRAVQHETQRVVQHENPHDAPHEKPHENPHEKPSGPLQQGVHYERIGDTVIVVESAVPVPTFPLGEAQAFLASLQGLPLFVDAWVAYKDLETLYGVFCEATNRPTLSWGSVARALGRMTKRRRRIVTEYHIPRPGRRRKRKSPGVTRGLV